MGDTLFERDHEHRLRWLPIAGEMGDDRTAVLMLCQVLARLDLIEAQLAAPSDQENE